MKQTLVIKSALITVAVAATIAVVVFAAQTRYVGRRAGHADEKLFGFEEVHGLPHRSLRLVGAHTPQPHAYGLER